MNILCGRCGTPSSQPYCPRHRITETQRSAKRGTSGYARQRANDAILARDRVCQACFKRPATEVDHVERLADGGRDVPSNKQGLCALCHGAKTRGESRG